MSDTLFDDFESVSLKQWKQKIQFDLKGASYNDTLIWRTNEGIDVKPFYHSDDIDDITSDSKSVDINWKICQSIFVSNEKKANLKAIDAINSGTESINFIIPSKDISIEALILNINLDSIPLYFELQFLSETFIKKLKSISKSNKIKVQSDIIGNLAKQGNWFYNLKEDFQKFESIFKQTKSFSINASLYQNAGATMVQQLAYSLAHANEYLNVLCSSNEKLDPIDVTFNIAIGTNYFFEISKLRALRKLWNTLASEYDIHTKCVIVASPSKRNKTLYDYNTNMLRTTTECMSAILGGANIICNLPYDAIYHKDNEFGERIARNQLLILKHESYFDKVNNPSEGSYYIETITNQFCEKALSLFKDIEDNGGFLNQLKAGTIQRKIKESALNEQELFDSGNEVLIGTNKHPNPNDKMKDELELYPFVKTKTRKTLIEPIIEKRLSETLEQKRLKQEKYNENKI